MFESAELGHKVDEETYDKEVPKLREPLLDAQYDAYELKRFPVIIVIGGVDGAGKGETVNLLNEWMDPRHIHATRSTSPTDEERERPRDVALLARAAAQGQDRHLLRLLVHRADRRARAQRPHDNARARAAPRADPRASSGCSPTRARCSSSSGSTSPRSRRASA